MYEKVGGPRRPVCNLTEASKHNSANLFGDLTIVAAQRQLKLRLGFKLTAQARSVSTCSMPSSSSGWTAESGEQRGLTLSRICSAPCHRRDVSLLLPVRIARGHGNGHLVVHHSDFDSLAIAG